MPGAASLSGSIKKTYYDSLKDRVLACSGCWDTSLG